MNMTDHLNAQRDAGLAPSDEWLDGWRDGREALAGELDAAYRRGKRDGAPRRSRFGAIAIVVAFIAGFLIAAAIAAPNADASAPTPKQAFRAKAQRVAVAYGNAHAWTITGKVSTTVTMTTFLGKTQGYARAFAIYNGKGISMAMVFWNADLTRVHGKWVIGKLRVSSTSVSS